MSNIGFIGLGRMGQALCFRLLEKGVSLYVSNRTFIKAAPLLEKGARWCDTPEALVKTCRIIILCLSDEKITETWLSDSGKGFIYSCHKDSIIIDTGTISPASAEKNSQTAKLHQIEYVSCPISGGIEGAITGTLAAIVAAPTSIQPQIEPLIKTFASHITWVQKSADAQKLKILNNLSESINLIGAFEVLNIGLTQGLEINKLHSVLTSCRGRSAYMDVALKFIRSGQQPSDVSLAVRCKDLYLSSLMIDDRGDYVLSHCAKTLFDKALDKYGGEKDQCEYFNFINQCGVE